MATTQRKTLLPTDWDFVCRQCATDVPIKAAEICGAVVDPSTLSSATSVIAMTMESKLLDDLVALCHPCHEGKHMRMEKICGWEEEAMEATAKAYVKECFAEWGGSAVKRSGRSTLTWSTKFSVSTR